MARIDSLRIFTEVIRSGNFSTAAKALGLTPSAISKQIGALEERLGVRLLHRTTRSVSATEAGKIYYERGHRILEELEETESLISDMDSIPRGTLKIAAERIFGRAVLARIVAAYREAYPEVLVELFLTDQSISLVKQGFDIGFHLGQLDDPALATTTLTNHSVVLCASADYIAAHGKPESASDLSEHKLIKISSIEFHQPRQLDDYFDSLNLDLRFELVVNDIDMAYHAVMTGGGISPLPNYIIRPQLERGNLKLLLPHLTSETHPVQLIHHKHRHLSRKSESFKSFLVDYFKL